MYYTSHFNHCVQHLIPLSLIQVINLINNHSPVLFRIFKNIMLPFVYILLFTSIWAIITSRSTMYSLTALSQFTPLETI